MPTPTTQTYANAIPLREAAARFPAGDGDRYDRLAGLWSAAFYLLFSAYVGGWIPAWLFGLVGVCAYVRNFNALHEGFHAPRPTGAWRWARHLMIITSPLMLGYGPLRRNHGGHHTWAQQPARDPDAYLAYGPWWRALVGAITQPEQGFVRYVRRCGLDRAGRRHLVVHTAAFAAVALAGGVDGLVAWLVVTRIANTASWFIFDWVLHQPWAWGRYGAPAIPAPIRALWILLFGADNLLGVEHHHIHHQYPFVPGSRLPALSRALRGVVDGEQAVAKARRGLAQHCTGVLAEATWVDEGKRGRAGPLSQPASGRRRVGGPSNSGV